MNASWSPLSTFREAAHTSLGRVASCFLVCSLGAAVGYGIDLMTDGTERFDFKMMLMSVVPVAAISMLYNWGMIVYPSLPTRSLCLCATGAFAVVVAGSIWSGWMGCCNAGAGEALTAFLTFSKTIDADTMIKTG